MFLNISFYFGKTINIVSIIYCSVISVIMRMWNVIFKFWNTSSTQICTKTILFVYTIISV